MRTKLFAAAAMTFLLMSHAAGQSILQKSDWQGRKLEMSLPRPAATVPWLELDPKTKLPKGDIPLGRDVASFKPFVLTPHSPDTQLSSNAEFTFRSM